MSLILEEAASLVHGSRQQDYAHPSVDFGRTAKMWSVLFGVPVDPKQVPMALIMVKLSRLMNDPTKRDSIVDIAGYAETMAMLL